MIPADRADFALADLHSGSWSAGTAVFLATPAASYITGQVIFADGGVTIAGG